MEFSIQKVKRCGKSVLCPHRREAARVVFFTVFLPFLLLLLWGIFLYHSPRFFSVKLMGQTVFVSVFAVGTAAAAIFFLFFYLPLWLGAKYWYLEICRPGKLRVPFVFYYFSSLEISASSLIGQMDRSWGFCDWNSVLTLLYHKACDTFSHCTD